MANRCRITFEGLNIGRLLGVLNARNIPVFEVQRQGRRCCVQVPSTLSKQTIAILQERCYNILGVELIGLPRALQFAQKHFVFLLFCVVAAVFLALSSQFCRRIDVAGDFEEQEVCSVLDEMGVSVGCNLRKLNLKEVENALANNLDAMYAVVKRSGSVLYVNAVGKKTIEPPIDLTQKRNIVAPRAGVVIGLVCEQGNPLVKIGDTVKAGDVLIEGKRIFNDGTSEDVYALGRVTLSIKAEGFAEFDGTKQVTVETGNTFTSVGVVLFGKEYVRPCPFEHFTVDVQTTKLSPLNLEIRTDVFREIVFERVSATIEECLDALQQSALDQAQNLCDFAVCRTVCETKPNGVSVALYGEILVE